MRRMRFSGLGAGIAIGAALAVIGFGVGAVVASIPASAGTINGCYSTTTGALRVIDYPSHHCVSGERFLRWNQTTVPGAVQLLALQGTSCATIGAQGRVYLSVTPGTGAVSIACETALTVKSSVSLSKIDLLANANQAPTKECLNATTCSAPMPYGLTSVEVDLQASVPFHYTCPGSISQGAYTDVSRTLYLASCTGISMATDRTVIVTAP